MMLKTDIGARAGPLLYSGDSIAELRYWKTAITTISAVIISILLLTQFGRAARIEREVEVAFSHARQLLHEADKENRKVRPLPLSLAKV